MRTVRRLYFYAVAIISLEVVLWGLIGLVRVIFSSTVSNTVESLAQGLALILVGVPVFALHWWAAQRSARGDEEEHASAIRAAFLYGALLGLLIPVVQNLLALVDRALVSAFGFSSSRAVLGAGQNWVDNLIAIAMNLLIAAYFLLVVRDEWATVEPKNNLRDIRRLYRYIWVLYGLGLLVAGLQQLLQFVLTRPVGGLVGRVDQTWLANGLAFAVLGAPVWAWCWRAVQNSLSQAGESRSVMRLAVLYVLSLAGVTVVLSAAGIVVDALLRLVFGEHLGFDGLMQQINGPLSIGIPLAGVWAYYGRWLNRDLDAVADAPRRAGLRRFYYYILSLIGLVATFIGVSMLLSFAIDTALGIGLWAEALRPRLTAALATILAGLPLWLLAWSPMQDEALAIGDEGDHARRSVVRKAYLYFVLFGGVVGGMVSAVRLVFLLLSALLGQRPEGFSGDALNALQALALFVVLLTYHWRALRRDGLQAIEALASKHAQFPVLVLASEGTALGAEIRSALEKQLPKLPLTLQNLEEGLPPQLRQQVKAIVLPGSMAVNPPEALRLWLREFNGRQVIIPDETPDVAWAGSVPRSASALAGQVTQIVRQMAEGQEVHSAASSSGWTVVMYVFAALFALQLALVLLGLIISAFVG
jgi:hypothetical protein